MIQIGPRHRRVEAAQQIIATQRHDHAVDIRGQRPFHPCRAARRGIPRHARIDQPHISALILQPALQLRNKPVLRGQPIALRQRVPKGCDHHRLGCGRKTATDKNTGRQNLADFSCCAICQ